MSYRFNLLSSLIIISCGFSVRSASAAPFHPPTGVTPSPAAAIFYARPAVDKLIAQAQAQGSVRVIVGLRTSFQPEGNLRSAPAISVQRREIQRAQDALLNQLTGRSIRAIRRMEFIPHLVLEADANAIKVISASPAVTSITEDRVRSASLAESVPLIGAPTAWSMGYTGAGQTIAILDSGVDKNHPFLAGRVVSEGCYSTTDPVYGYTSLCPGGVAQSTAANSGLNCTVNSSSCFHGTHVAGIAAGRDNGSIGFSGVAKNANIIAIQVFSNHSGALGAWDSDILAGLERVQTLSSSMKIASVNLSLGGGAYSDQSFCDADNPGYPEMFANLRSLGIAPTVASGNSSSSTSLDAPGCVSTAISVGSTNDNTPGIIADDISSYSNSASFLTLLAPGMWISSSVPGGGYQTWAGTSMATPHVAGAFAVLKSGYPNATIDQILTSLQSAGKPITDGRNGITKPRIRIDATLTSLNALFPIGPLTPQIYLPLIIR
jgi:subtilisin